jgi:hypothetical protein
VNEAALQEELQVMRLTGRSLGKISLVNELQQRKALLTSWPRREFSQLRTFVNAWQDSARGDSSVSKRSILDFWRSRQLQQAPTASSQHSSAQGVILYELSVSVGLVVRACPAVGLNEDVWCSVYPNEMQAAMSSQTFGAFLENLFPQLKAINGRLQTQSSSSDTQGNDVTVKYYPHKKVRTPQAGPGQKTMSSSEIQSGGGDSVETPARVPMTCYQTIGTFSLPAVRVISR